MVRLGPLGPIDHEGRSLEVRLELTDEDVAWLNAQLELGGAAPVRYARSPKGFALAEKGKLSPWGRLCSDSGSAYVLTCVSASLRPHSFGAGRNGPACAPQGYE